MQNTMFPVTSEPNWHFVYINTTENIGYKLRIKWLFKYCHKGYLQNCR